jgi:hypothetical protein
MVATTFLYIIIILCYVNKQFDVKFWRNAEPIQKNETYSRDFFVSANIIQQVAGF